MMDWPTLADLSNLLDRIPDIVRDPTADPRAAVLLFAGAALVFLIAAAGVIALIVGSDEDEDEDAEGRSEDEEYYRPESEVEPAGGPKSASAPALAAPLDPAEARRRVLLRVALAWSTALITVVAVWSLTGVATIDRTLCEACHPDNPHAGSIAIDPHPTVACVACHESGDLVALAFFTVPDRLQHFIAGELGLETAKGYGRPISSFECRRCHRNVLSEVIFAEATMVRVSHAEPLVDGAECVDCHRMASGVVSSHNTGMVPCLRCHDGTLASVECDTCHVGDPAEALRASEPTSGVFTKAQIDTPDCSGCHDQAAEGCDACHGIRLPHTRAFMQYAHARPGVEDIWYNGGRTCAKCHTDSRPCSRCHDPFPSHGLGWRTEHTIQGSFQAGCNCHEQKAYSRGRVFCQLCHETDPRRR